jgi:hypothetical protein
MRGGICGHEFTSDIVAVCIGPHDTPQEDICPECLASGAEGMAKRATQRAGWLDEQAAQMRDLAAKLKSGTVTMPTVDEYASVQRDEMRRRKRAKERAKRGLCPRCEP